MNKNNIMVSCVSFDIQKWAIESVVHYSLAKLAPIGLNRDKKKMRQDGWFEFLIK